MFSDMELEAATGQKANKSALESARAFVVQDEGNIAQRLEFIRNQDLLNFSDINQKNYNTIKSLGNKKIASMSDKYIAELIRNPYTVNPKQLKKVLNQFSPDELNKITNNHFGSMYLNMLINKSYNTAQDLNDLNVALKRILAA